MRRGDRADFYLHACRGKVMRMSHSVDFGEGMDVPSRSRGDKMGEGGGVEEMMIMVGWEGVEKLRM